jgi:hypothetical protein
MTLLLCFVAELHELFIMLWSSQKLEDEKKETSIGFEIVSFVDVLGL